MKHPNYTRLFYLFGVTIILLGFIACSKMDDTYKDFVKNGERVYIGKADSVRIYPGKNRLKITWSAISDPRIIRSKIYWNNRTDSIEVPVHRTSGVDTINVMLEDLEEGNYSFDIITFDEKGNSSIAVHTTGEVYGDLYQESLLNRTVKSAVNQDGIATVLFGEASEGAVFTEVNYTDIQNAQQQIRFPAAVDSVELLNIKPGTSLQYRTVFLPDTMAIDTFYTDYLSVRVKGVPVEYSKIGWGITASSFRAANPSQNAIDNDAGSLWINANGTTYPFSLEVDMKLEQAVDGFTFTQRTNNNGQITSPTIELCEIEVSDDGQDWRSLGLFTLKEVPGNQYFDLPESETFRYFRTTFKSSYNNVPNGAIAEIGVYYR